MILPVSARFANEYAGLTGSADDICRINAKVCERGGRSDIARIWNLAALVLGRAVPVETKRNEDVKAKYPIFRHRKSWRVQANCGEGVAWEAHPFGPGMVKELLDYCLGVGDFQTYALLSCVFFMEEKVYILIYNKGNDGCIEIIKGERA